MSHILIHPTYFPSITTMATLIQSDQVTWEIYDHYQKQTYRNRCYIYGANGRLMLQVPIRKGHTGLHQQFRDTYIDHSSLWWKTHWKSLETAYRSSSYFEYYESELHALFESVPEKLVDWNLLCLEWIYGVMKISMPKNFSSYYQNIFPFIDLRSRVHAKTDILISLPERYQQVFIDKLGFISNLSILDLWFNKGPNSIEYLKRIPSSLLFY